MFIKIYRNLKTLNSWNWFRYETFIRLFEFKGFSTWGERERHTQSFYADCFYIVSSQPNQRAVPVAHKFVWPRWAPKVNLLLQRQELNSCFFSNPKIFSPRFWCVTSFTSLGPNSIWDFYLHISEWHILSARAWTPALMLNLTNPCTKRKVLILTKPKGKIYKTKSLGNYIT